jgi:hypothetical protein
MLSSLNACLIIVRVSYYCSEISTKCDAYSLSDPSLSTIRPDIRLQIKGHRISSHPHRYMKCCITTPKICQYHHILLHHSTTTAVQMAAPVPETMDSTALNLDCHLTSKHTFKVT